MSGRKLAIIALILSGLLAALLIPAAVAPSQQPNVLVSFAGYTNDSTGSRLAVFKVTNRGSAPVWQTAAYSVEARDTQGLAQPPRYFGRDTWLAPAESRACMVSAYSNQTGWRARLYFSQMGPRERFARWTGRWPPGARRFVPLALRSVRTWVVESDWIDK